MWKASAALLAPQALPCPPRPQPSGAASTKAPCDLHKTGLPRRHADNPTTYAASILLAGLVSLSPPAFAAEGAAAGGGGGGGNPLRALVRAPAEFYRSRQQQNGGAFFLGPIQLSRQKIQSALDALEGPEPYSDALTHLRAASLQCYNTEITTAATEDQEYKLGDPCKLRLVVKNATTLTKDAALVAAAESEVKGIVR